MKTDYKHITPLSSAELWALRTTVFFSIFIYLDLLCSLYGIDLNLVIFLYFACMAGIIKAPNLSILLLYLQVQIYCLNSSAKTYIKTLDLEHTSGIIFDPFFEILDLWSNYFCLILGFILIFYCARYFFESQLKYLSFSPFFISLFPKIIIVSLIYMETSVVQYHLKTMLLYSLHIQRMYDAFLLVHANGEATPLLELKHFQYGLDLAFSFEVGIGLAIVVVSLRFLNLNVTKP
jgi:hypothetical protein